MRRTTSDIEAAKRSCRHEMDAIRADLSALLDRASAIREDTAELTGLKAEGVELERCIRLAKDQLAVEMGPMRLVREA